MAIFEIKNLSFKYPEVHDYALRDINIEITEGDFVVIAGESGCGKTTLLRLMKRELAPYGKKSGEIYYNGILRDELDDRTSASEIGYVMQNPESQIVTDKVWHELAFGLENLGLEASIIRRRVAEMASFFGIQDWFRKSTALLSGGQKQLLNLASIMVMNPRVLILDEPTAQLDPIAASDFINTLRKINKELGLTIILVEHRLEEVYPIADKVIIMDKAKVLLYDTPKIVGEKLSTYKDHNMLLGLPTSVRIYNMVNGEGQCPLTIREGREYIRSNFGNKIKGIVPKEINEEPTEIIEVKNAWFRYERDLPDVLRGVNLSINQGEVFCILGGNGTGKSTMLKAISGTCKIYRGKIVLKGKKINDYKSNELYKHNLALLPQNPEDVFLKDTLIEDINEIAKVMDYTKEESNTLIEGVLKDLKIEHLKNKNPYDLSGGEKQKAALAKILLLNPQILLLDEPTKGIDAYSKSVLKDILLQLKAKGKTIIIVTHDLEFAASIADRCALLFDGEIVSSGSPQDFFESNSFYTTSTNRIARGYYQNCVNVEDVVKLCELNSNEE